MRPLPDPDQHRQYVFLDLTVAKQPAGRLVIELFDDMAPAATSRFKNRCMPGATGSLLNAQFHKLVPYYGIFGGKNPAAADGVKVQQHSRLQHAEVGAVSLSHDGDEIAIALARSPAMDASHQVTATLRASC